MEQTYTSLLDSIRPLNLLQESSPLDLPDELELQSIWFNGQFGRDFTTTCGKQVHIEQFGFWNRSAGPDFLHAAVTINGEKFSGPLEIDTQASDWETHGHDTNPSFEKTILHVIFQPPHQTHFTRTHDHREVPKVIVPTTIIQAALNAPLTASAPLHLGRCFTPLAKTPLTRVTELLQQAAKHRALTKAKKLRAIQKSHGKDQALWTALAETLGYRPNKLSMTLLSQRLPIRDLNSLTEKNTRTPAIIFGTAGFLHPDIHKKAPPESQDYLENLWQTWWQDRSKYELDDSRSIPWILHGNRPINHPQRRIATLSAVAQHWPTFRKLSSQPDALTEWLSTLTEPTGHWSHHYTLTSQHSNKKLALIGKDRIQDLIINHLLPIQISEQLNQEKNTQTAWQAYQKIPAPAINHKVKRAHFRLFGDRTDTSIFLKKSWHHQALIQIYQDFCLQDTSDCKDCPFPEQLAHW